MTKTDIDGFLTNIFKSNKHFIGNLYKGNERCIQGDLYLEIIKNGIDVYLEFPFKIRDHIDIAKFDTTTGDFPFIIETKHRTPHYNPSSFVKDSYIDLYKDIIKRNSTNIKDTFLVLFITEITSNNPCNFPFYRTYVKTPQTYILGRNSQLISQLDEILKKGFDSSLIHKCVEKNINSMVDMKLHYFILQPDRSNINNIPAWSDISLNPASNLPLSVL